MYVLTIKNKKRQIVAVAHWTGCSGSCLATAEKLFSYYGFDVRSMNVQWQDNVEKQKNFAGYAQDCKYFIETKDQSDIIVNRYYAKRYLDMYDGSMERLRIEHPELCEFV